MRRQHQSNDARLNSLEADADAALCAAQTSLSGVISDVEHLERLATLGTLAAGVAHEINNILTPVLAYAQLASAHPEDQDLQAKAIDKAVMGVEIATRIASSILGFAGNNDASDCDVASAVEQAMNCLAHDPNKSQIDIRVEVLPGTIVKMNPLSLQQVLINLILNSRQAMSEQGRHGRLTIAALTRADGTIGIRVSDNGPGLPKDIAGRIFEPFVTGRKPTPGQCERGGRGGHGLGLSICRRLVEQAGGSITATSTTGQGTTFLIVLPSPKQSRARAG